GACGQLMGAFEAEYELTTTRLEPGDVLLLYTDGIIERRGKDLESGLRQLIDATQRCVMDDPEELIDCVLAKLSDGRAEDDVCVLAARVL
ncbi:SpoIIE family protein phosphatase, partial [Actinomadura adrarensis]